MADKSGWDAAFARGLRDMRERLGRSQQWVAEQMVEFGYDWYQTTVYKAETGGRRVTIGEAASLAEILNTDLPALLESEISTERTLRHVLWTTCDSYVAALLDADRAAREALRLRETIEPAAARYDDAVPAEDGEFSALESVRPLLELTAPRDFVLTLWTAFQDPEFVAAAPINSESPGDLPWDSDSDG